jgi:isopentenyl-diphosphate Delta-isomerase
MGGRRAHSIPRGGLKQTITPDRRRHRIYARCSGPRDRDGAVSFVRLLNTIPGMTAAGTEELILVDERNRAIGRGRKDWVHAAGLLHRAFSIFLVDGVGRLLLQRRHHRKYHSGGLWSNSCCGHPRPGERTLAGAQRRLREELGVRVPLRYGFRGRYRATLGNGMTENEIVYVYFGFAPEDVTPDHREISAVEFRSFPEVRAAIAARPEEYAVWFRHYLRRHFADIRASVQALH